MLMLCKGVRMMRENRNRNEQGNRTENLTFRGTDSIEFARALFFPNKAELSERAETLERIESYNVEETSDGFSMDIGDLDLSFLDEEEVVQSSDLAVNEELLCNEIMVEVSVKVSIQTNNNSFSCDTTDVFVGSVESAVKNNSHLKMNTKYTVPCGKYEAWAA